MSAEDSFYLYSRGSYFCFYLNFLMKINLKTLPSNSIDTTKWNNCIAGNKGLIYATKSYLDLMAKNWFGVVVNDYEVVFPICLKQKFGIKYSYTPAFVQQLGIVGNISFDTDFFALLQAEVLDFVKYGDIHFNYNNEFASEFSVKKNNLIIDLSENYEFIYSNYKTDLKQNLKKAQKENYKYTKSSDTDFAINTYQKMYGSRMLQITNADYDNFKELCKKFYNTNNCFARQIVNNQNEILSIGLFLKDDFRIYNIANSTTDAGRQSEANHFLLDRLLNEFAETNLIFDFEGSDLPGVKQFYEKFGAINQPYFHWHFNELPALLKLLKK